ncbi:expressed protein [Phakopsora pachyrhizi]|uniref:Expressed protein n=1 Tax=Phakopsora pachyrhizi TaxID=170000 RepID=A0AAV0APJ7_PHAPC|nr:expressed protein [Phakopsora pachyrhizi]
MKLLSITNEVVSEDWAVVLEEWGEALEEWEEASEVWAVLGGLTTTISMLNNQYPQHLASQLAVLELWAVVALVAWAAWEGSVDSSKTTRPRTR